MYSLNSVNEFACSWNHHTRHVIVVLVHTWLMPDRIIKRALIHEFLLIESIIRKHNYFWWIFVKSFILSFYKVWKHFQGYLQFKERNLKMIRLLQVFSKFETLKMPITDTECQLWPNRQSYLFLLFISSIVE